MASRTNTRQPRPHDYDIHVLQIGASRYAKVSGAKVLARNGGVNYHTCAFGEHRNGTIVERTGINKLDQPGEEVGPVAQTSRKLIIGTLQQQVCKFCPGLPFESYRRPARFYRNN